MAFDSRQDDILRVEGVKESNKKVRHRPADIPTQKHYIQKCIIFKGVSVTSASN